MNKKSTPLLPDSPSTRRRRQGPKASTLDMLRQFARCYSPTPALTITALSGMIAN